MKKILLALLPAMIIFGSVQAQDQLPSNPEPGKCYVKCITPDEYKTETITVADKPAYNTLKVTPAEYKTVTEKIMVKPATKKFVYKPAVFETYYDSYESEQGYNKLAVVPAKLKTVSKEIEVQPVTSGWEYGVYSDCKSDDPRDCRVLCFKEYPAVSETVYSKEVDTKATTTATKVPGKTSKVKMQKIVTPASVEEIVIPAEYQTITKKVLVKDEATTSTEVAATTKTISKEVLVKKGGVTVWEEVDCKLTTLNILPIYYELGSARLTSASKRVIDNKLLALLNAKPNIRIELNSHTDSRGEASSNQALSQARANSVVSYLTAKGVNKSRLVARGFGETKLKNKCADGVSCSEAEHQKNRRTEFRVIGF